jgi:hypothetical protein
MLVLSAESRERTRPLSHPEVQGTLTRYQMLSSCLPLLFASRDVPQFAAYGSIGSGTVTYLATITTVQSLSLSRRLISITTLGKHKLAVMEHFSFKKSTFWVTTEQLVLGTFLRCFVTTSISRLDHPYPITPIKIKVPNYESSVFGYTEPDHKG